MRTSTGIAPPGHLHAPLATGAEPFCCLKPFAQNLISLLWNKKPLHAAHAALNCSCGGFRSLTDQQQTVRNPPHTRQPSTEPSAQRRGWRPVGGAKLCKAWMAGDNPSSRHCTNLAPRFRAIAPTITTLPKTSYSPAAPHSRAI